ncbi:MAG: SpoIIE family protein phosphatase [Candidatus Baltobacteraceae bacterium]
MKVRIPVFRSAGILTATAILIFALAIAVAGAFLTRSEISKSFDRQARIQAAQLTLEQLVRMQIDEENYVRGYILTRDPFYVDQFDASKDEFHVREKLLRAVLGSEDLVQAQAALFDYDRVHQNWHELVADPLMKHPNSSSSEIDKISKGLTDQQTEDSQAIQSILARQNAVVGENTQEQINRTFYAGAFWLIVFGLLAILFNAFRSRSNRELEEERMTSETLQRAFRSVSVPLPNCELGTGYSSATRNVAVGGDVFDVYQLSDSLALVLIADVSGKGIDAAVLTAFIKFTIRGIALRRRDPGAILAEFNTAFPRTVEDPYLFVSMFVGILDTQQLIFRYGSAGHDSAFLRRGASEVQQLAVTGPILGVMEEPFGTQTVHLDPGDTIVLATDGLTEARNAKGEQLEDVGAIALIATSSQSPQKMASELIAAVKKRVSNRMRDDLAILAIRVNAPETPAEPPADV